MDNRKKDNILTLTQVEQKAGKINAKVMLLVKNYQNLNLKKVEQNNLHLQKRLRKNKNKTVSLIFYFRYTS